MNNNMEITRLYGRVGYLDHMLKKVRLLLIKTGMKDEVGARELIDEAREEIEKIEPSKLSYK